MTIAEFRRAVKKKSRYGVAQVRARGEKRAFGSAAEAERGKELRLLEKAGVISDLKFQVPFHLVINAVRIETYIADSTYHDEKGNFVVEDVKHGLITSNYARKCRWMRAANGIVIHEHHKPRKR